MKSPGEVLHEAHGWTVPWADLDERVRRQFQLEAVAVWNSALDAVLAQQICISDRLDRDHDVVMVDEIKQLKVNQ